MEATKTRGKIIITLRDRRRIEETIRRLACISGSAEAEWEARCVADMGDQVIPALTGLLDTSDPRLLGAIGLVATCLDHKEQGCFGAISGLPTTQHSIDRSGNA